MNSTIQFENQMTFDEERFLQSFFSNEGRRHFDRDLLRDRLRSFLRLVYRTARCCHDLDKSRILVKNTGIQSKRLDQIDDYICAKNFESIACSLKIDTGNTETQESGYIDICTEVLLRDLYKSPILLDNLVTGTVKKICSLNGLTLCEIRTNTYTDDYLGLRVVVKETQNGPFPIPNEDLPLYINNPYLGSYASARLAGINIPAEIAR